MFAPVDVDPLAATAAAPPQPAISSEFVSPSPDPTLAAPRPSSEPYVVQSGDTLSGIAYEYATTVEAIARANGIEDGVTIDVGQVLSVPVDALTVTGPAMKIAPDGEVVYGPGSVGFDVQDFVSRTNGYLRSYTEGVEGQVLTGAQIVQLVAERYSVGPRILLALLEYLGGWLSNPYPDAAALYYPAGHAN